MRRYCRSTRPVLTVVVVVAFVTAVVCTIIAVIMAGYGLRALTDSPPRNASLARVSLALRPFATGLTDPVQLTYAPDGSGRVYILEQSGLVLVADANGKVHPKPFLDLRSKVLEGGERGLLSLAFHPDYKTNGIFFIDYTNNNGDTMLARYHVSQGDPLHADPASATQILLIRQPGGEHKSGQLFFGPDGYLYLSVGDGGLSSSANGQRLDTLLGKIIRIDVNRTSEGHAYAIPPDNPFVGDPHARAEIWAYGLRNAWRFSFDRTTGDLFFGEVGNSSYEEIDFQRKSSHGGENYGWAVYEGTQCEQANCSLPNMTKPIVTYAHQGGLCAVMGGFVYRGTESPALYDIYLYADYCSGRIFGLVAADAKPGEPSTTRQLYSLNSSVSSFGEDEAGELYVVGYMTGTIYHLTATTTTAKTQVSRHRSQ